MDGWMNDELVLLGSEQSSLRSLFSVSEFSSLHLFWISCHFTLIAVVPCVISKVTGLKKMNRG